VTGEKTAKHKYTCGGRQGREPKCAGAKRKEDVPSRSTAGGKSKSKQGEDRENEPRATKTETSVGTQTAG